MCSCVVGDFWGLVGGAMCSGGLSVGWWLSVPLRVGGCDRGVRNGARLRKSYEKGRKARKGYEERSRHGRHEDGQRADGRKASKRGGERGARDTHPYKQRLAFGGVLPSLSPCGV